MVPLGFIEAAVLTVGGCCGTEFDDWWCCEPTLEAPAMWLSDTAAWWAAPPLFPSWEAAIEAAGSWAPRSALPRPGAGRP
jgi:hypothetical protein